jgi:hypothetical protein
MEELLEEIGKSLGTLKSNLELDEKLRSQSKESGLLTEHLIKKIVNVKVKMYQENHKKPHVHLDIGSDKHIVSIDIENLDILAGTIDKKYKKRVIAWIENNQEKLLELWNLVQDGQTIHLPVIN